jgi:Secretion system C-terminal sorting domain/PKD-like domain/Beta-propeller repeat
MKKLWGLKIFIVFLFCIITHNVFSKENKDLLQSLSRKDGGANTLYIENKGQIGDQDGKPNLSVKYLILRPGLNIQLKANSFSYDAYTIERFKKVEGLEEPLPHKFDKQNDDSLVYHFSRVDIELVDANPNPQITHEGASSDYLNYYTHITSQTKGEDGATGVRGCSTITYHDIYPNIDLEWFLDKDGKPEYQFIINPGGDPSRIRLKYHGAKKTELISDAIHIHIKPGIIKEHIPLSYLKESKEKLHIAFTKVADDEYGFNIPTFASNETLIIDPMPNRLWGTYYGGSGDDSGKSYYSPAPGNALATDATGNVYLGGNTKSISDIASTGAYDVTIGGSRDAFLIKLSSSGSRIWGTYYGGEGEDECNSLALDASGDLYLYGTTWSTSGIGTTGAWDVTFNNQQSQLSDAFLVKFSSIGSRIWGTYYGGSDYDYGYALTTDASGNVYLTGRTFSTTEIASTGAYNPTKNSSFNFDSFLVKFSSGGSRIWGTYYGGEGDDIGNAVATDNSGNVYLCGSTSSIYGIALGGEYDFYYGGVYDAFLVKFSSSGSRIWGTYYGGESEDYGNAVAIDSSGNVYLGGSTKSTVVMASNGAYDVVLGYTGNTNSVDAFLAKFSSWGTRKWATYYGGGGEDVCNSLAIDASGVFDVELGGTGDVYLGGYTKSTTDIASNGAYDETLGGISDAFLVKFSSAVGTRIWGTYYGGGSEDACNSLALDASGNVFLSGDTKSSTNIASTVAYDVTLDGLQDAFLVKFDGNANQITSPSISSTIYCQNQSFSLSYTVTGTFTNPNTFTAQLSDANGSFINPTSIGTVSSTTSGSINCRIPSAISVGSGYRIRIISSNPSVIGSDNGTNIIINALPQPSISGSTSTCEGSLTYTYTVPSVVGHTYQWTAPSKGTIIGSTTGNTVSIRWTIAGIDSVKVRQTNSQTSCFKDTTIIVSIQSSPNPVISGAVSACQQSQNNSYSIVNIPGHLYQWYAPTRGVITGSGTSNTINVQWTISGIDSIKVRQTNPQTGCFKDTSMIVTIQALPMPLINGRTSVCATNKDESYSVAFVQGHNYQWFTPSKGKITSTLTSNTLTMQWTISGIDSLKVRQTNPLTGCYKDTMLMVTINELPRSTITGIAKACALSKTSQYSVPLKSNYTYQWGSITKGNIVGSTKENTVEVFWTNPGIDSITVRTTNSLTRCSSDTSFIVSINTSPSPQINGTRSVCVSPNTLEYSVKNNATSQYAWQQPKLGMIVGLIDGNTVKIRWNATGSDTLFVRETNTTSGCSKDTFIVVTILSQPQPTISGNSEVLEQEKGLVYSVQLENGSSYEWSIVSGDATITTKSGQLVVVNVGAKGSVILKVVQTNKDGCVNEAQFVITVKSPSGVNGEAQSLFSIYPNPIGESNQVLIDFTETLHQDISIELLDILGTVHYSNIIQSGSESCTIPIQGLSSGMYVIRLRMDNQVFIEKLIVN